MVHFHRSGVARSDDVDVRSGLHPGALQNRRCGRGDGADDVGPCDRLAGLACSPDRQPGFSADHCDERGHPLGGAPPHGDVLQRPDAGDGAQVGCGFDAVAEDREPPRIGTRERVGRDCGCGTGPDGCHLFGVRERDRLSVRRVEQHDDALVTRAAGRMAVGENADELGAEAVRFKQSRHCREQMLPAPTSRISRSCIGRSPALSEDIAARTASIQPG